MMRNFGFLTVIAALALTACGGGSPTSFSVGSTGGTTSSSSSSSSSGANTSAAAITLISSQPNIPSNNSKAATLTAIVKNASNSVVTAANVVFSSTSGIIAPTATSTSGSVAGVTDSNGEAQAVLSTPGDSANRDITVTATVGRVSQTITIAVVGTSLSVTGPASLIKGATGTFSVSLSDSGGAGIPNTPISLTSSAGNTLSAASINTGTGGQALTFTLTAVNAGNDTITASALGISSTASVSVSAQSFNFSSPAAGASVALGVAQPITLTWTNNGAPVANQSVTFSTTRGLFPACQPASPAPPLLTNTTTTTATTNSSGSASVTLCSNTAGPAVITASGSSVSAQLTVNFVATDPSQIDVQGSPTSLQTSGSSTVTAIVRDPSNNLVQGATVDFQLTDLTGGSISVGSAVTDASGRAQTVYTATSVASAAKGVIITATVQGVLYLGNPIQSSVDLTVGGQTLFLALGTGNTITADATNTQFIMPYSVQAIDSSGNAVSGVVISLAVHSLPPTGGTATSPLFLANPPSDAAYRKGAWIAASTTNPICATAYCQVITASCLNEDVFGTGIFSAGLDTNGNGKFDPGDVASVSPGTVTTDSTGSGRLNVTYPQDHALWVQVLLTATATVSGTESSTSSQFWLPILATDITTPGLSPPGGTSPYGQDTTCADAK